MMQDWQRVTLRDIAENVQYGYTASASKNEVGPKFLRITDIVPDLIDWNNVPYCEIAEKDIAKYSLIDGDIVVARTGATTGYAKQIKGNPNSVFASYLVRIQLKPTVNKVFVGKIVESQAYKRFIKQHIGGAAQPNANAEILTSYPIDLPHLPIQRKIASILSAYDDLIENNTRRIKILEEMAQRIYKEWFVDFRYPGYENQKVVESKLGMIPERWEVVNLGDFISFSNGKSIKPGGYGMYPVFGANGLIGSSDEYRFSDSVIIGRVGAYCGAVQHCIGRFWASDNTIVAHSKTQPVSTAFIFYLLQTMKLNTYAGGSAQPLLTQTVLVSLETTVPLPEHVSIFTDVANTILYAIKNLTQRNQNLRRTRDLLLPKFISGKLDVSELDIETGGDNNAN